MPTKVSLLVDADEPLDGTEHIHVVQDGVSKKTTIEAVAESDSVTEAIVAMAMLFGG